MGKKTPEIDKDNVVRLYEKFGTMSRTALSAGCDHKKVKQILIEKGIEIKPYVPERLHIGNLGNYCNW
jgi:hypothetical protein